MFLFFTCLQQPKLRPGSCRLNPAEKKHWVRCSGGNTPRHRAFQGGFHFLSSISLSFEDVICCIIPHSFPQMITSFVPTWGVGQMRGFFWVWVFFVCLNASLRNSCTTVNNTLQSWQFYALLSSSLLSNNGKTQSGVAELWLISVNPCLFSWPFSCWLLEPKGWAPFFCRAWLAGWLVARLAGSPEWRLAAEALSSLPSQAVPGLQVSQPGLPSGISVHACLLIFFVWYPAFS